MTAHSSSIGPLSAFFAGMEYQDSLRYYRKEKPIVVSGTTGKSQLSVGIASCHRLLLPLESENPTFLEPFRPHLPNHLGPEYHELIAHNNQESYIDHLVNALWRRNTNLFINNHEQRGEDLNTLFKRIEDSRIAEYDELIAGPDAVRCRLEKPPIISGRYQGWEINSPVDRTHFKSVVQERVENYIGHLVNALRRRNINLFINNHEQRGEDLNTLFKRIEDSGIAEYDELIAGTDAVRCRLEKPPIISGRYQGWEIDSPVDRTHFKSVVQERVENYIGHLVNALRRRNINLFINNHEQRGEDLNTLFKRIEDSGIAEYDELIAGTDAVRCRLEKPPIISGRYQGWEIDSPVDRTHFKSVVQERQESELIKKIVEMAKREKDNTSGITKHIKEMCKKVLQSIYYMCSDKSEIIKEVVQRVLKEIPSDGNFKPPQDQVYINYLGDQLKNFIPYLMDALQRRKVNVFIDNLEKRGENLDNFSKRIGGSGIAIVVFSSRYTESERVMDGLVRIVECERQARLKVLPVFHNVPPSDVKRLKGKFGDHFRDKELLYGSDSPKIKQWKDAISYVSHKFLLAFNEKSGALEIDFVESIVKEVLAMLQAISTVESGYR